MAMGRYLGIDLGTSGIKLLLMDADQRILGAATASLTVSRPQDGWSEQHPADWITATRQALPTLAKSHDLRGLQGIGLSGQMHGAVCLDRDDQVLRPAILWNDGRAEAEASILDAIPAFRAQSGNIVFAGFTAPKLVWMAKHEPELFARVARVLLPKDYLRLWLTGEHVSDMSDAAGTSWLDCAKRDWSDDLLAASGMSRAQMPALVEGSAISGRLRGSLAAELGLPQGVVVAGGAGDNAASAIGAGSIRAGQGFVSLGTSGVIFTATDSYLPLPESAVHAFCHALPQTWHHMGVVLQASAALEWYGALTGTSPAALTQALGDQLAPPCEALFLPYLSGERTPHNNTALRASFHHVSSRDSRETLTRAVLEGVSFALKDAVLALHKAGSRPESLLALGGGAQSRYWLNLLATILELPVELPESGDFGAAFGAARLGLLAHESATAEEVCHPPRILEVITPDPALITSYGAQYDRFRSQLRE